MIDIEKFICSLLADHPEGVAVRGDIHKALKEQGLEYKDGKIVPVEDKTELKESEDEKIRNEIISYIKNSTCQVGNAVYNSWIAWLEKQGKNNTGISETTRQKLEDNLNKALEKETPESWNEFLDKQGEQKLVEWSEEDEEIMSTIMEEGDLKQSERNWLKSIKDRIQSKTRKKNIEQNLAKKYGITGIGSKHAEGKLGEMIKKKIETENVDKIEPRFKVGEWITIKE